MTRHFTAGRFRVRLLLAVGVFVIGRAAASAQAQALNVSLGGTAPRGEGARVQGDVLNENRRFLSFDVRDFTGPLVGVEWLLPAGDYFEVGAGAGFYRRSVPSVYTRFVNNDGSEIEQTLRLRTIPAAFTLRVVPTGQRAAVQPYFGAGIGVTNWRYTESGEFVDFSTARRDIFRDTFFASGNAVGAVALAGLRFSTDGWMVGGEVRYTRAEGKLGRDFAGDRIDLGALAYQFTIGRRF